MRDLRQFYTQSAVATGIDKPVTDELLEGLRSEDARERRLTRSRISDYGKEAIPGLLDLLETNRDEYRVRVGVATALMLMDQPVPLTPQEANRAVRLLGDADATVRKNTAVFLGELTDPAAIEATRQALEQLSKDRANLGNGNLVYNSVIVLGDWLVYNPAISDEACTRIKASLQAVASALDADTERQWANTRAKIAEYLG